MNKIVILVFLISVSSSANSQENLDKFVIDTVKGLGSSFILSSSELEKELNSTLLNIESNCCSENFEKKEELLALSKEMKECKNNKSEKNNLELQNNIESIMDAYEKKIAKLEESNKKLQEELTNSKMKKLR